MSGHEYRDIGRKIIGLLVRPVLRALRAAWDRLEKSHEQPGLAAARTMPAQTAQYRGPTRGGQDEAAGHGSRLMDWHGLWLFRSEEHTSELQSLMRNSYAVFCLKKKNISP